MAKAPSKKTEAAAPKMSARSPTAATATAGKAAPKGASAKKKKGGKGC